MDCNGRQLLAEACNVADRRIVVHYRGARPIQAAPIALTAQNGICLQLATMVLRPAGVYAELRGLGPSSTPRQRVEPRVLLQERFFPVSLRCANWARLAINT